MGPDTSTAAPRTVAAAAPAQPPRGYSKPAPSGTDAAIEKNSVHASERLVPMFNNRFLFDDELDAHEDSTFVHKYNLSAAGDDFSAFLKSFTDGAGVQAVPKPSHVSSALDLASLSSMPKRSPNLGANATKGLSPWLHAATDEVAPMGGTASAFAGLGSIGSGPGLLLQDPPTGRASFPELFHDAPAGLATSIASFPPPPPLSSTLPVGSRPASFHGGSGLVPPLINPTLNAGGSSASPSPRLGSLSDASATSTPPESAEVSRFARAGRKEDRRKNVRLFSDESDASFARGLRRTDMDLSVMPLEDLCGEISHLCRDQYGCRFLQKKLDEGIPAQCDLIFTETFPHFADLMTDPFGNYLCQKLLEHCTNAQRDQIVEAIAKDLVTISLNMHGTRAVQKTIDFVSTPAQTQAIINAFALNVVTLIKDLNGNHVIQKCLNRLSAGDNQFIYDAVAAKCVDVSTHRHGCCVLQRCIDHASDEQRLQLVQQITMYSLTLVQDPFGNYVVQYVLDLNDSAYTKSVTHQFLGHVCELSTQKFSSNVMEKCIRVAEPPLRQQLVAELIESADLEALLRDSFANYVVQTCLDYAEPAQRAQLVDRIRPILPSIRHTPYGKRIQTKLQREDSQGPNGNGPDMGMRSRRHDVRSQHAQQGLHGRPTMSLAPGTRPVRAPRKGDHYLRNGASGAASGTASSGAPCYAATDAAASLYAPLQRMQLNADLAPSTPFPFASSDLVMPTRGAQGP
ncbi:hypothetical protein MNAN1_002650 [Malassezia nana]|uniref:PUM-HD domain-containing protein n=1 Tax=Malassezia nana TaxID=180528 RepID=A0AAF0EKW3_9BASI|nr:hypothetical protein MNAN1_002650 [Malassezia nana]